MSRITRPWSLCGGWGGGRDWCRHMDEGWIYKGRADKWRERFTWKCMNANSSVWRMDGRKDWSLGRKEEDVGRMDKAQIDAGREYMSAISTDEDRSSVWRITFKEAMSAFLPAGGGSFKVWMLNRISTTSQHHTCMRFWEVRFMTKTRLLTWIKGFNALFIFIYWSTYFA